MALKLNGQITGSPIAADADPNAGDGPAENRLLERTPVKNGHVLGGTLSLFCFLDDGTSLDIVVWVKVPGLGGSWHALNAAVTVAARVVTIIPNIPPDATIFVQALTPVGAPTNFGFACV